MDLFRPATPFAERPAHRGLETGPHLRNPLFLVRDLAARRGDRLLFRGLSFSLEPGQWIHVEGANGSGKTTLLRILCGLAAPDAGEARLEGRPLGEMRHAFRYLGHAPAVTGALTPLEHLEIHASLHGTETAEADLERVLDQVGLGEAADTPCLQLSAGQQRRVALARLLVTPGRLWLLDEPLTALDRAGFALFHDLLQSHLAAGGAAVITTHQPLSMAPHGRVVLEETAWTP